MSRRRSKQISRPAAASGRGRASFCHTIPLRCRSGKHPQGIRLLHGDSKSLRRASDMAASSFVDVGQTISSAGGNNRRRNNVMQGLRNMPKRSIAHRPRRPRSSRSLMARNRRAVWREQDRCSVVQRTELDQSHRNNARAVRAACVGNPTPWIPGNAALCAAFNLAYSVAPARDGASRDFFLRCAALCGDRDFRVGRQRPWCLTGGSHEHGS
jgi:hypothetical protein